MTKHAEASTDPSIKALVVVAGSSADPYLAPFAGPAHLASSLVVEPIGGEPKLGFFSPMEREQAALSGLGLLTPEQLSLRQLAEEGAGPAEIWTQVIRRGLELCGVSPGPIAMAGSLSAGLVSEVLGRLAEEGWTVRGAEPLLEARRRKKNASQLADIRRASRGAMEAFRRVASILASATETAGGELHWKDRPLTVGHLRRQVARIMADHGLDQPHGNIVAPGEEGAVPHNTGSNDRVLRAGQSLVVDLFPKSRLYSDCTRTFCVGEPAEVFLNGFSAVQNALQLAASGARAGVQGWDLQLAVCDALAAAGYRTPVSDPGTTEGYVHGLGHGVGFEIHELPLFRSPPKDEGILAVGDVITLEPGLYSPEQGWAVRLENLYSVEHDGLECLTPLPLHWDPRRWSVEVGGD